MSERDKGQQTASGLSSDPEAGLQAACCRGSDCSLLGPDPDSLCSAESQESLLLPLLKPIFSRSPVTSKLHKHRHTDTHIHASTHISPYLHKSDYSSTCTLALLPSGPEEGEPFFQSHPTHYASISLSGPPTGSIPLAFKWVYHFKREKPLLPCTHLSFPTLASYPTQVASDGREPAQSPSLLRLPSRHFHGPALTTISSSSQLLT